MIRPLENRVVILPDEPEKVTQGGILLPDDAQGKPTRGTVIAVGTGRFTPDGNFIPMLVEKGQKVLYDRYEGKEIREGNQVVKIMYDTQILAVLEDDATPNTDEPFDPRNFPI